MSTLKKALFATVGMICAALGIIGIFLPVLPTTPFLLLAAFLLSRSSERLNRWLAGTRAWRAYVEPFKSNGGISRKRKARILAMSYSVMLVSALLVRIWFVWLILVAVAVFLLMLMWQRIPTISEQAEREYGLIDSKDIRQIDHSATESRKAELAE